MNGFVAGLIGDAPAVLINRLFVDLLKVATLRYADFAAILILGRKPHSLWEGIFAQLGQILFSALLGVSFAYLIPRLSTRYYYFKGAVFGAGVWFLSNTVTVLFKVPGLTRNSLASALVGYSAAIAYGITLAYAFRRLENRRLEQVDNREPYS